MGNGKASTETPQGAPRVGGWGGGARGSRQALQRPVYVYLRGRGGWWHLAEVRVAARAFVSFATKKSSDSTPS